MGKMSFFPTAEFNAAVRFLFLTLFTVKQRRGGAVAAIILSVVPRAGRRRKKRETFLQRQSWVAKTVVVFIRSSPVSKEKERSKNIYFGREYHCSSFFFPSENFVSCSDKKRKKTTSRSGHNTGFYFLSQRPLFLCVPSFRVSELFLTREGD